MGESESAGVRGNEGKVNTISRARERKRDCNCGSEKCDCDNSCHNFKEKKSFLDIVCPRIVRDTLGKIVFCVCVLILYFLDVVCPSFVREQMGKIVFCGGAIIFFLFIYFFGLS